MRQTPSGKIAFWGSLWGGGFLLLVVILDPTPENLTLGAAIPLSGLYTWLLYQTRDRWIERLASKPFRNAVLLGSFNAAVIETLFLAVEKGFGASGVAAHPNLLVDLALTMPWYFGMVWIFVKIQRQERFPAGVVLLLGGIYELGADGILGGVLLPALMGSPPDLLEFLILMLLGGFWQFIPVYSSMVLPPAWVLDSGLETSPLRHRKIARGFLPLLWLLPFSVYLFLSLLFGGFWGS